MGLGFEARSVLLLQSPPPSIPTLLTLPSVTTWLKGDSGSIGPGQDPRFCLTNKLWVMLRLLDQDHTLSSDTLSIASIGDLKLSHPSRGLPNGFPLSGPGTAIDPGNPQEPWVMVLPVHQWGLQVTSVTAHSPLHRPLWPLRNFISSWSLTQLPYFPDIYWETSMPMLFRYNPRKAI